MLRLGKIYATKGQMNETARAHFNEIKKAYKVLSNPYRRSAYDASRQLEEQVQVKQRLKNWLIYQWQEITQWKTNTQQLFDQWPTKKPPTLEGWGESSVIKGWQFAKSQITSRYINNALIPGEKILYHATMHWLFYLDAMAILLVVFSSYWLINNPFWGENMPSVLVWVPAFISKEPVSWSVWQLGLLSLWSIGLMVLGEVFILKQTTELAVTSKRLVAKFGFLNRTIIELKLRRFESITVEQSLLGRIFNYGTVTITGMGGVRTTVPCIVAPLKFKKVLWQVIDHLWQETEDSWI